MLHDDPETTPPVTQPRRPFQLAIVSDAIYPYHMGGKEVRYRELCSRLPSPELKVTIYTMKWWTTRPPDGNLSYRAISPKLTMYRKGRRSMAQAIFFAIFCVRLLRFSFDAIEADHMPYIPLFSIWLVAKIKRVPLIVTWHEVWGTSYWQEYLGASGRIAAILERLAARLPTIIVAVSPGTAARLGDLNVDPGRVAVIPGGVDAARLAAIEPDSEAPDLLCVCRLLDHKRVDVAIEVAAALISGGQPVTLGIVGEGPERDALEQQAAQLGIGHAVTFYGSVAETDRVLSLMKGASVLLYATEREGFGLVAVEAMALGTPVITSTAPSNEARRLVTEGITGSLREPGDVEGFTEATRAWLERDSKAEVRRQFFEIHPEVDWTNMVTAYRDVLEQVGHLDF